MKMTRLKELYSSMKYQGIERYKFEFKFHNKTFEVLYSIDEVPHKLAIGLLSHNYYFEIEVKKGFNLTPFIDDYNTFCKIMGFEYNPDSPFKSSIFFEQLNNVVPFKTKEENIPKPHEIAQYRRNVEESDKIYFVGWLDNNKRGNKVSEENLEKTRKLLSEKAYKMCKEKNISSRWSDKYSDSSEFNLSDFLARCNPEH